MRLGPTVLVGVFAAAVAACSGSTDTTGVIDDGGGSPTPNGGGPGTDSGTPDSNTASQDAGARDTGGPPSDAGDSGKGGDADSAARSYPSGPYGVTVGAIIQNMTWMGYADDAADAKATTKPYAAYSLNDAFQSGKHYAMINLAESDCPGCQKSAGEIAASGKAVVDAGGVVIEVLETTGFITQASKTDLDAWVNKYALPVTTVKDPDGTGTPTLNALGQREQAYVIDLTTMTIVQIIAGDITGIGETSGGKAMTAMHQLLGK